MSKFYINTPIYYVNAKPHIGHAYTTMAADSLARWHRLRGDAVHFVTGTDENSQKNIQAMEGVGMTDLTEYLDKMAAEWRRTWQDLEISLDDFIRTTEPRHLVGVERFWAAVKHSGDIYEGAYEGLYCSGCEGFKTHTDIVDGVCPLHPNKPLQQIKERNYFFRLSAYRDELLELLEEQPDFVMPDSRRNEIRNYIRDHLSDISISREAAAAPAGIPVPGDDSQRIYVWFDALLNYLTAVGYGSDEAMFKKHWPTDLNLVGKDIIKFHGALWPAMLMSAAKHDAWLRDGNGRVLLPRQVYAHGFFTLNGQKISKSLGNAIDPRQLTSRYGLDAIRYFLLREVTFGEDGDFSFARLEERYQTELGNTLGNLFQRVIAMSRRYGGGKVPIVAGSVQTTMRTAWAGPAGLDAMRLAVEQAFQDCRCDRALEIIWNGIGQASGSGLLQANKYIEDTQPFKLVKTEPAVVDQILYDLLEACRWYAWLLQPIMPQMSRQMFVQLGLDPDQELARGWSTALVWGGLMPGTVLPEPQPLFPRLDRVG